MKSFNEILTKQVAELALSSIKGHDLKVNKELLSKATAKFVGSLHIKAKIPYYVPNGNELEKRVIRSLENMMVLSNWRIARLDLPEPMREVTMRCEELLILLKGDMANKAEFRKHIDSIRAKQVNVLFNYYDRTSLHLNKLMWYECDYSYFDMSLNGVASWYDDKMPFVATTPIKEIKQSIRTDLKALLFQINNF